MSKLSATIYLILVLCTYGIWSPMLSDTKPAPQAPATQVDKDALANYHDLQELVRDDLKTIKEECPTCITLATTGVILQPGGTRQETAVIYVWHPGIENMFIQTRKDGANIIFVFLPTGDKDPALKLFLSKPPEVK